MVQESTTYSVKDINIKDNGVELSFSNRSENLFFELNSLNEGEVFAKNIFNYDGVTQNQLPTDKNILSTRFNFGYLVCEEMVPEAIKVVLNDLTHVKVRPSMYEDSHKTTIPLDADEYHLAYDGETVVGGFGILYTGELIGFFSLNSTKTKEILALQTEIAKDKIKV